MLHDTLTISQYYMTNLIAFDILILFLWLHEKENVLLLSRLDLSDSFFPITWCKMAIQGKCNDMLFSLEIVGYFQKF